METLYFEELPIELNKLILDYLDELSLITFNSLNLHDNVYPIWNDYYYWVNRIKREYPFIKDPKYLIKDNIFIRYLRLKDTINNVMTYIVPTKIDGHNISVILEYLHEIPYRYLLVELQKDIKDLYVKSLDYGDFVKGYSYMFFTGYGFALDLTPEHDFSVSILDGADDKVVYRKKLTFNEGLNIIVMIKYLGLL